MIIVDALPPAVRNAGKVSPNHKAPNTSSAASPLGALVSVLNIGTPSGNYLFQCRGFSFHFSVNSDNVTTSPLGTA